MAKSGPRVKPLRAIFRVLDQPGDAPLALPLSLPLLRDDARRGAAEVELLAHPLEVDALVAPRPVESALPTKALLRDRVQLARELDDPDAAETREERLAVDFPPERYPLVP